MHGIDSIGRSHVDSFKNLAAPFYRSTLNPSIVQYGTTYLETVCRMRFPASATVKNNEFIDALKEQLETVQMSGQNIFQEVLKNQNVIEIYVANSMFAVFIQAVLQYAEKINEYRSLASRLSVNEIKATKLSNKINMLEQNINYYKAALLFIPTDYADNRGHQIQTGNPLDGVILPELMRTVEAPAAQLEKELSAAKAERDSHKKEISAVTKDRFYLSGEVSGIGTIDMMACMLAFWMVSTDTLLSMLDNSSFGRLHDGMFNRKLRTDAVEKGNQAEKHPSR